MSNLHRTFIRLSALVITAILILPSQSAALAQRPIRIIWLHHSVGFGIIDGGGVREGLTALGYEFYDHGYNGDGLRLADGSSTGTNFDVPDDNTDPDGLAAIFSQPRNDPPDNTFSHLMQYDVIIVKSCFPTSNIGDDDQLEADKDYYRTIASRMDQYPDKLLIIVTHPPQVPDSTDADEARRARALNDWLLSDEFQQGRFNLHVFDLFGRLAGSDNLLRSEYRVSNDDAHPNDTANATIGPELVEFVGLVIGGAWGDAPPPPTTSVEQPPADQPTEEQAAEPPSAGQPVAASGIDDFEAGADAWHGESDRGESAVECVADGEIAHGGSASLRLRYEIAPAGWINCSRVFDPRQNWGSATGISFWLRTEDADQFVTLSVFSGDVESPTPFELTFDIPEASLNAWSQVTYAWPDFERAEWADANGLQQIDPARVTGYNFTISAGEETHPGVVWLDDVTLVTDDTGEAPDQASQPEAAQPEGQTPAGGQPQRGLCGGAALLLPLAGLVLAGYRRRR